MIYSNERIWQFEFTDEWGERCFKTLVVTFTSRSKKDKTLLSHDQVDSAVEVMSRRFSYEDEIYETMDSLMEQGLVEHYQEVEAELFRQHNTSDCYYDEENCSDYHDYRASDFQHCTDEYDDENEENY